MERIFQIVFITLNMNQACVYTCVPDSHDITHLLNFYQIPNATTSRPFYVLGKANV